MASEAMQETQQDAPRSAMTCAQRFADRWRQSPAKPSPTSYPPISSIPRTTSERLSHAAEGVIIDTDYPQPKTYLYLAYGSNLAAKTFLGVRGIRPLSQVNVSVPTLRLTFSLPGMPYWEPCFANVDWRKPPKDPKVPLPDPRHPPKIPPIEPPVPPGPPGVPSPPSTEAVEWDGGLMGVVYEVTEEDYKTIIRTEGGGASYKEVVVPCIPLPPRISVPEKPPIPELPRPFMARTLFAPYLAPGTKLPDDPRKDKWWYPLVVGPYRPNPDYAQPSARYLKLLTDGAREHELPDDYQEYMQSLEPYKTTSICQQIGKFIFFLFWGPIFMSFMLASNLWPWKGKDGKLPPWLTAAVTIMFNIIWVSYDKFFKPVFGDGEKTQERETMRRRFSFSGGQCGTDEEKTCLLRENND